MLIPNSAPTQSPGEKTPLAIKKVKNLFYAGQLTVAKLGVPPSIISDKVFAQLLIQSLAHT